MATPAEPPARDANSNGTRTRVVLVGIGGATCSGKTTLAKHLRDILPDSFIIHQDDFAPPEDTLPLHPTLQVRDWDSAPTALDWPRLRAALRAARRTGTLPPNHVSHDHLNAQRAVPVADAQSVAARWRTRLRADRDGVRVVWGLVDGFLLYWDKHVVRELDAKFFLRVPREVLAQRRVERQGYYTAEQLSAEGGFWVDPPGYFEQLVWPAYVEAHTGIFENGDVERGAPTLPGLVLIEPLALPMDAVVERCCAELERVLGHLGADEKAEA